MSRRRSNLARALPAPLRPRDFGRRAPPRHSDAFARARTQHVIIPARATNRREDLKLFATTFLGGFIFVSLLIA